MVGSRLFYCLFTIELTLKYNVCDSDKNQNAVNMWFKQVVNAETNVTLDASRQFGTLSFRFRNNDYNIQFAKDVSLNAINSVAIPRNSSVVNITDIFLYGSLKDAQTIQPIVSAAIIKLADDGLDAIVHTDTETIFIEPACRYKHQSLTTEATCKHVQFFERHTSDSIIYTKEDMKDNKLKHNYLQFDFEHSSLLKTWSESKIRQKRSTDTKVCNLNLVADYEFFVEKGNRDVQTTVTEMLFLVREADIIFRGTDFNGDGAGDNVGFHTAKVTIYDQPNSYHMYSSPTVEAYLNSFSNYNFNDFCLAVAFTSREFAGGVIGLAWVASSNIYGPSGGICQTRIVYQSVEYNLNTCLVTTKTSGGHMPVYQTALVLAHELGHNFGSPHDDSSNSVCTPSDEYGNYLMYPYAADGTQPNNIEFSMCSISYIYPVILNKGICLKNAQESVCGNSFQEGSEQCDCGSSHSCDRIDKCCTASDVPDSHPDAPCTLRTSTGSQCSPRTSACCTDTCIITSNSANKVCRPETDCINGATCNGISAECPGLSIKPNGTKCQNNTRSCLNGRCAGSICLSYQQEPCTDGWQCECHVCCKSDTNNCSMRLTDNLLTILRPVGTLCQQRKGYCNGNGICVMQSPDGAMDRFSNIFSPEEMNDVKEWFKKFWYYVVATVAFLGILVVIFVKTCRGEEHIHTQAFMYGQLLNIQREAEMQKHYLEKRREETKKQFESDMERLMTGSSNMEFTKAVARMIVFFPTAPRNMLIQVLRSSASEEFAVKTLLTRGFPLRRICDQHVA